VRRFGIILAACALMAADVHAEATTDSRHSQWPEEKETRTKVPLAKWLRSTGEAQPEPQAEPEPVVIEEDPAPQKRARRKRAFEPEPAPEPEPKLTPEQQEAEDRWWKEVGDVAVAAFSRCLGDHVLAETASGSQSSYPDFVTAAMNGRCSREFAAMAQVILQRHGQENFARIARKLIATKFVPMVKQVVEVGPPEVVQPEVVKPSPAIEMRQTKEAMLGCLVTQADRLSADRAAPADLVADRVIGACQSAAEDFLGKLEQLYPGSTGGKAGQGPAAILNASYRHAILERIATIRGGAPVAAGAGNAVAAGGGKADSLATTKADAWARIGPAPEAGSQQRQDAPVKAVSPVGVPAPASASPASNQP
jgi:hypothetical protein